VRAGGSDVGVVDAQHQQREVAVQEIVQLNGAFGVVLLARERTAEVEPELRDGHEDVLVEDVAHGVAHADVVVAAVLQQQVRQEAELRDGVVGGVHRLKTLLSFYSHLHADPAAG
jgi:activator of 2-hydroxyglutaryl-CoA dehydratase